MKIQLDPHWLFGMFTVDCPRLEVCGDHCEECDGTGEIPVDLSSIACLFHNLAIAAGLERAYELGSGSFAAAEYGDYRQIWTPGAGVEAP